MLVCFLFMPSRPLGLYFYFIFVLMFSLKVEINLGTYTTVLCCKAYFGG